MNTSNKGPSSKKKGRSKKAHVLAVSVEQATQNFLEKGEQIAKDSHDLKEELISAVDDVRKQGELDECVVQTLYVLVLCHNIVVISSDNCIVSVKYLRVFATRRLVFSLRPQRC